jgi:putative molybdopterin biosynthesis protein
MAVKKGVCHLAGSHLLDTQDGSYNLSYVKKYLPDKIADNSVRIVHLVFRDQGLIVSKGNPKSVRGVEDLQRDDLHLINRQGGSGTRILLDYHLKKLNVDPGRISGYENEEFTHMSVAVAVLGGSADVGMGIYAAAKALDLDFIPVVTEQYDLIVPQAYFDGPLIQMLMDTINSNEFKHRVEALGGYHTHKTGHLLL